MSGPANTAPCARPPLVVIVGPNGAGKSQLALALAEKTGAEIVSADSQQVYIGMDIGTGKVPATTRARIRHHIIDVVAPDQAMTAARFVSLADAAIAAIAGRQKPVIVAGGTGLYVRALLLGLFPGPARSAPIRRRFAAMAAQHGSQFLWSRLARVDAATAARLDARDVVRITRALEVYELTGVPLSEHHKGHDHRAVPLRYPAHIVGLSPRRDELYRAIDARVDGMIAAGLFAEVQGLRAAGYRPGLRSQAAIGYAEVHRHLDGTISWSDAVQLIKRNSRRYARRQLSWYRGDRRVLWRESPRDVDLEELGRYLGG